MTSRRFAEYTPAMNSTAYEICVEGRVDPGWEDWFEGLTLAFDPLSNRTKLRGNLPDQAALYGVIAKFRDLGLNLVSLTRLTHPTE